VRNECAELECVPYADSLVGALSVREDRCLADPEVQCRCFDTHAHYRASAHAATGPNASVPIEAQLLVSRCQSGRRGPVAYLRDTRAPLLPDAARRIWLPMVHLEHRFVLSTEYKGGDRFRQIYRDP
jgi:hypothetical protein